MTGVFPTPVGVFPHHFAFRYSFIRLPHARGGVSFSVGGGWESGGSSPRPWGCFSKWYLKSKAEKVFPTPVGVFPEQPLNHLHILSLPHARGGVSSTRKPAQFMTSSSPRPWGCFERLMYQLNRHLVFPTPVGVFPGDADSS